MECEIQFTLEQIMNPTASKRKGVQGQTVSIANDRIELRRLPAPKRLRLPTRQNLSAAATKLQAGLEEGGSSDRVECQTGNRRTCSAGGPAGQSRASRRPQGEDWPTTLNLWRAYCHRDCSATLS